MQDEPLNDGICFQKYSVLLFSASIWPFDHVMTGDGTLFAGCIGKVGVEMVVRDHGTVA